MSECIYKTKDGFCTKYSDNEVKEYCVEGPCNDYTVLCTNYTTIDHIMYEMILLQKQMEEIQFKFNELTVQIEKAKENVQSNR